MKFLKISLAASLALGALSTASFAQPLEEAIKGVDVSGYLRYRYTDDRYDNGNGDVSSSSAKHQWRAEADFKTPTINNVSLDLGILYRNDNQNVNHGNVDGLGSGLGAGQDSDFGVSQFYMAITPDSTATTVMLGKQKLGTPVTNPGDGDRGTGILALNSDIPGLTLAAGAFDSWAIDDLNVSGVYSNASENSVDKPLYTLAAIYGVDTSIGNIGAQVWFFNVTDMVDAMIYSELSWKHSVFNASLQYGYASLKDGNDAFLTGGFASDNDLLNLRIGANFKEYNVPLGIQLGYLTNFQDGTTVSVDDEGAWTPSIGGKLWWQNNATGVTFGLAQNINTLGGGNRRTAWGEETDLSVFHGVIDYTFLDGRFKIGLEGAFGENERTISTTGVTNYKTKFTEITPTAAWKHSKNLTISGFYAMLSTEDDRPNSTAPDEDRNRARVEVKYTF